MTDVCLVGALIACDWMARSFFPMWATLTTSAQKPSRLPGRLSALVVVNVAYKEDRRRQTITANQSTDRTQKASEDGRYDFVSLLRPRFTYPPRPNCRQVPSKVSKQPASIRYACFLTLAKRWSSIYLGRE